MTLSCPLQIALCLSTSDFLRVWEKPSCLVYSHSSPNVPNEDTDTSLRLMSTLSAVQQQKTRVGPIVNALVPQTQGTR